MFRYQTHKSAVFFSNDHLVVDVNSVGISLSCFIFIYPLVNIQKKSTKMAIEAMDLPMNNGDLPASAELTVKSSSKWLRGCLWKMMNSMDWFQGKSTGNHGFYHQI